MAKKPQKHEIRPEMQTQTAGDGSAELQQQLQEQAAQLKAYIDRLKHLQADFENYKKRVAREREELTHLMEDQILLKVLPIYDGFELAFRAFRKSNDKDSFIEGMERIFAQFHELLKSYGVQPIEVLGKPFDPALHEALLSVETEEKPHNTVIEEFERGYRRGGRLLRPSRVKVSKRKSAEPQESQDSKSHDSSDSQISQQGGMEHG